jgi:hypothetical protein
MEAVSGHLRPVPQNKSRPDPKLGPGHHSADRYACSYAAGATFSAGHFLAVPFIGPVIDGLRDEEVEKKGQTMETLRKWLRIHAWRSFCADLPALLCYIWLVFAT